MIAYGVVSFLHHCSECDFSVPAEPRCVLKACSRLLKRAPKRLSLCYLALDLLSSFALCTLRRARSLGQSLGALTQRGASINEFLFSVASAFGGVLGFRYLQMFPPRRPDWRAFLDSLSVPSDYGCRPDYTFDFEGAMIVDNNTHLHVSDERPVQSSLYPGVHYFQQRCIGSGTYGAVYRYEAQPYPSDDGGWTHPPYFVGKWATVGYLDEESPWTELSVVRLMERRAGMLSQHAVLSARILQERIIDDGTPEGAKAAETQVQPQAHSYTREGFHLETRPEECTKIVLVAMEPARAALEVPGCPELSMQGKLSWRDAVAVARAALDDVARLEEATGLLHIDIKPANFLWDESRGPETAEEARAAQDPAAMDAREWQLDPRNRLHVFAADYGSLTPEFAQGPNTYASPAGPARPLASWDVVAFQLGWLLGLMLRIGGDGQEADTPLVVDLAWSFSSNPKRRNAVRAAEEWRTFLRHVRRTTEAPPCFETLLNSLVGFQGGAFVSQVDRFHSADDIWRVFGDFDDQLAAPAPAAAPAAAGGGGLVAEYGLPQPPPTPAGVNVTSEGSGGWNPWAGSAFVPSSLLHQQQQR